MSETVSLELIGRQLRAMQTEQRAQRILLELITTRMATRQEFDALIDVIAGQLNRGLAEIVDAVSAGREPTP